MSWLGLISTLIMLDVPIRQNCTYAMPTCMLCYSPQKCFYRYCVYNTGKVYLHGCRNSTSFYLFNNGCYMRSRMFAIMEKYMHAKNEVRVLNFISFFGIHIYIFSKKQDKLFSHCYSGINPFLWDNPAKHRIVGEYDIRFLMTFIAYNSNTTKYLYSCFYPARVV